MACEPSASLVKSPVAVVKALGELEIEHAASTRRADVSSKDRILNMTFLKSFLIWILRLFRFQYFFSFLENSVSFLEGKNGNSGISLGVSN
jgi:hypothetical protein